jgi:hypothetical protein
MKELIIQELKRGVEENLLKDKCLVPTVILCGEHENMIVDAQEGFKNDESKDKFIEYLCAQIKQHIVYRAVIISECWGYADGGLKQEVLAEMFEDGSYREKLDRTELYQIIDIKRQSAHIIAREFSRENQDTAEETISFGHETESDTDFLLMRFKRVQNSLQQLN